MRCITVYTNNYSTFSEIYEDVLKTPLGDHEEKEVEGITISDAGGVPDEYIEMMKQKPEVAVMRIKKRDITILQHGDVFEILVPTEESA
ncbi:NAD/NADP transhydrogenase alpha subunit [Brevibacillus daliensis]|uniref:NAD/NADP transhydrogenase alpha subunit n=1 Tax=Brevibacillus daliensis TaxID=2892995 RepID=UPI001E5E3303|nr:NAD/NADP transhydrogenase alpha subunit [Brevibacillus daliensis]